VIPAVVPTGELRRKLSFTKPYLSLPLVIATRSSEIFIDDLGFLEGKQIGYVAQGGLGSTLRSKYPSLRFEEAESVREGLQRVRDRANFAFVGSIPSITFAIQKHNFYNIKVSGTLPEKLPLAAAVQEGNERLLRIVQKGLHSIPLQQRERVVDNWISIRFDEKVDYTLVWGVIGAAALVLVVIILWTRKVQALNAQISEANALLEEKNRELEELSVTDKLTGLFNRSKIELELEQEQKRSERNGSVFSIIIFDIDWFKSINDTYGHVTGDEVLREIADRIRMRTRDTDIAGRWGGEEFLVICPETDAEGAGKLAEDIRSDIEAHSFGIEVRVTVSAGVAAYTVKGLGNEGLVRLADTMLYKAKDGKNRVLTA
jgi:polar amino acid transport system substrate-binding protein